jgi:dephospho-CoA kinase
MIIAGITGTIGTGKSTVTRMFAGLGAFVIDSDQLARQVVEPDKPAWHGIVDYFGRAILNEDNTINRQKLAALVFNDPVKLHELNSIVHPDVIREDRRLADERKLIDPNGLIIKDIPLLLEAGPEIARMLVDKIIVVYASPEVQLKRLIARGMSEPDARSRINSQVPVKDKLKFADFVINNDGSLEETGSQVKAIYEQLVRGKPA